MWWWWQVTMKMLRMEPSSLVYRWLQVQSDRWEGPLRAKCHIHANKLYQTQRYGVGTYVSRYGANLICGVLSKSPNHELSEYKELCPTWSHNLRHFKYDRCHMWGLSWFRVFDSWLNILFTCKESVISDTHLCILMLVTFLYEGWTLISL